MAGGLGAIGFGIAAMAVDAMGGCGAATGALAASAAGSGAGACAAGAAGAAGVAETAGALSSGVALVGNISDWKHSDKLRDLEYKQV